jgi:ABC-2 type transport system permease protein
MGNWSNSMLKLMNWPAVQGLVLRHLYIFRRSTPRLVEMIFWPMMDLLVWGFLTVYISQLKPGVGGAITYLIGAMIFWDVIYRSAQGVSVSFLEDIWSRNVLNVFVAPVRLREFVLATYIVGLMKTLFIVGLLGVLSFYLYHFYLFDVGFGLLPFMANLLMMGWAIGMFSMALIMRYGQAVEALAWGIPFLIQPFAAVFYPLSVLPVWMQAIGNCIPATHVFEGMRAVLADGSAFPWHSLALATGLNIVWLVGVSLYLRQMFAAAREHGYLAKLGTQ